MDPSDWDWPCCACGCGEQAPARRYNAPKRGHYRGQPAKYLPGHNNRKCALNGQITCSKCGTDKPLSEFHRDATRALGVDCWCKACRHANLVRWKMSSKAEGKIRTYSSTRRARLRGQFVEKVDAKVVFERDAGICGICQQPADRETFHMDHVIPLARGGEHSYANVQVAHPTCNLRKKDRLPEVA